MTSTYDAARPGVWPAFLPIARGIAGAAAGFALGAGLAAIGRSLAGSSAWDTDQSFVIGYTLALPGWLFGVGVWERWGREWFGRPVKDGPPGWHRYLAFTTDHKVIGVQYLVTFLALFLLAGLLAMLIRIQLLDPVEPAFGEGTYNRIMSMHGIIMVAVAVAAVIGGFGNYCVPLMIGAEDMAFPRLNALSFWLVPPVAVLLLLAQAFGGWDSGWTAYPPLSVTNAHGQVFFNLAIITFGLSSILGGLNFIVTIVFMRAKGMTWGRLPIFVWSMFAAALLALTFTQFFAAAMLMVTLDRIAGSVFFKADAGGAPLLYQHVFWFYSHPAVYIFVLPGFGATLEILSHFSRKPLFAYRWAVGGLLGIVSVSGLVWAHHMFVSGMDHSLLAPFLVTTEIISIPTGLIFLSAVGTIWMGNLWLKAPMLFALGVVFNFLIGGVTGIYLADVPTDLALSDTYFVVAHFHYTIIGAEIFALFGAVYYWFPKITGRMYHEGLAQVHFWVMFIAFNLTFLPMFAAGLGGMNRRVATYTPDLQDLNVFIGVMAFILGSSFLFFLGNVFVSLKAGARAPADPWRARTLEWQTTSPPPVENFPAPPVVDGGPYDYGIPGARPHAAFPLPAITSEVG
ncbi:MAG TPA: cbb3-type cytochrome c oxidase subunit I [Dehalococcoidia bacterium]|nr:cbb3-type cytochrome c oxidase subunit I [Dehalococcoidia bacterium]